MPELFIEHYERNSDKRLTLSDMSGLHDKVGKDCIFMPNLGIELPELKYSDNDYIYVDKFFSADIKNTKYKFCIFAIGEILILSFIKGQQITTSIQITRDIDVSNYDDISFLLEKVESVALLG